MTTPPPHSPVFRLAIGRRIHISGWAAILLAPIAVPVILLLVLLQKTFGIETRRDLTAPEVAKYLQDFLEGTGGDWDWDDFTSVSITDPALDNVREEAALVELPVDAEGEATLRRLLELVRSSE